MIVFKVIDTTISAQIDGSHVSKDELVNYLGSKLSGKLNLGASAIFMGVLTAFAGVYASQQYAISSESIPPAAFLVPVLVVLFFRALMSGPAIKVRLEGDKETCKVFRKQLKMVVKDFQPFTLSVLKAIKG